MSPFDHQSASRRVDIDFQVPFRHRLRFTDNCFEDDWPEVLEVFEPTSVRSKIQVWLDAGVASAAPNLIDRIERSICDATQLSLPHSVRLLEGGEAVKNSEGTIDRLLAAIHDDELDRRNYVLVVGGGAVLDAVGYAAAIAHRGIRLIRFPTTTLAQADSGVGVKNAVNAFGKKNWKGTFAVPWAVINDRSLLSYQADRDFLSGFSEAVKVALLKSPSTFEWLCDNASQIARRDMTIATQAIRASVLTHLHHITYGGDPFEANEARPLDFGHWSAHKLESLGRYELRHGEAVSIGVALDVVYSSLRYNLPTEVVDRTMKLLRDLRLPTFHPLLHDSLIFDGLEEFRQHLGGRLTLTMLKQLGDMIQVHDVDMPLMRQAMSYLEQSSGG